MSSSTVLYTPEVLALATSLAAWPLGDDLPRQSSARSRTCGSQVTLGLELDGAGRIARLGMRVQACAIGQAAAALFAGGALGRSGPDIVQACDAIDHWLGEGGPLPDWPGIAALSAARDYPGRHGAIRLAWLAARELLP